MINELFILKCSNVKFQIEISDFGRQHGKGYCILSTDRLILINEADDSEQDTTA